MISGAREARASWFRRLAARAAARELDALVVPGPDIARAYGIDVEAAGLGVVPTPRHASVLLVVGEVPEGLKKAAAVAYAQMARPRAVLAAGAGDLSPLPTPDVSVDLNQNALAGGISELRHSFAAGAFDAETTSFEAEEVQPEDEEGEGHGGHGHMHHSHMDHGSDGEEQHGSMKHDGHEGQASAEQEDQDSGEESGSGSDSEMDHGDAGSVATVDMEQYMPVSGEDFMSMVEMTQGMPASGDGLIMEWFEAPYGPLFPGLPGGLTLTLTLDGDTVAQAEVEPGIEGWEPAEDRAGAVEGLSGRVARLDPLSPVAYRLLALRAVEDATGAEEVDEQTALARAGALERERAASHLGWLASFGYLIGDRWISRRAAELQLALIRAEGAGEVERLEAGVKKFVRRVGRTPLLKSKLKGIGLLGEDDVEVLGPVARACGTAKDARTDEPVYRDLLDFEPVVREGDDALARLRVRLEEVERSLELVREAGSIGALDPTVGLASSGTGSATVETPRGAAKLSVTVEDGEVSAAELDAPSTRHLELVQSVTVGNEVADALVGVASLDLSPWEASR